MQNREVVYCNSCKAKIDTSNNKLIMDGWGIYPTIKYGLDIIHLCPKCHRKVKNNIVNIEDIILLKYTGYNDSFHNKIYSSDIVTLILKNGNSFNGVVVEKNKKWIVEYKTILETTIMDLNDKAISSIIKLERDYI